MAERMAKLHKEYKQIYEQFDSGLIAFSPVYVQITKECFDTLPGEFKVDRYILEGISFAQHTKEYKGTVFMTLRKEA